MTEQEFDPDLVGRIGMTLACADADDIPTVDSADETLEVDRQRVQVMHNAVLMVAGGYFGDWMAEIIRRLHGHHKPQEEKGFGAIVNRLAAEGDSLWGK